MPSNLSERLARQSHGVPEAEVAVIIVVGVASSRPASAGRAAALAYAMSMRWRGRMRRSSTSTPSTRMTSSRRRHARRRLDPRRGAPAPAASASAWPMPQCPPTGCGGNRSCGGAARSGAYRQFCQLFLGLVPVTVYIRERLRIPRRGRCFASLARGCLLLQHLGILRTRLSDRGRSADG